MEEKEEADLEEGEMEEVDLEEGVREVVDLEEEDLYRLDLQRGLRTLKAEVDVQQLLSGSSSSFISSCWKSVVSGYSGNIGNWQDIYLVEEMDEVVWEARERKGEVIDAWDLPIRDKRLNLAPLKNNILQNIASLAKQWGMHMQQ